MTLRRLTQTILFLVASTVLFACNSGSEQSSLSASEQSSLEWAVLPGFSLTTDTSGFEFPTAIAFVKEPGAQPSDPLYFVAELRGNIKVVTNDRSVSLFASVENTDPWAGLPPNGGLAGMCLDDANGYVFVTFIVLDESGVLRNRILRFEADPKRFSTKPGATTELAEAISEVPSIASHQIGGCAIADDSLYVSIGDGREISASQDLSDPRGKVLRLTLDGAPHPDNPFLDMSGAAPMVWAYGFRNPFGMTQVDGEIYITDNGLLVDRFVRVQRGRNYQWDGTDDSMGVGADVVFAETIGPVHLAYVPAGSPLFPQQYTGVFYVGMTATVRDNLGVKAIPYALDDHLAAPPFDFIKFPDPIGTGGGRVVAVAVGPDGLYFAQLHPNLEGETPILKAQFDPKSEYPALISSSVDVTSCQACHLIAGNGVQVGPDLQQSGIAQLQTKLESDEFLAELRSLNEEGRDSLTPLREQVLGANDEARLFIYIRNKIIEPRFANESSQMPTLAIEPAEAALIATYLIEGQAVEKKPVLERFVRAVRDAVPFAPTRPGDIAAGVLLGFTTALGLAGFLRIFVFSLRRRRARRTTYEADGGDR